VERRAKVLEEVVSGELNREVAGKGRALIYRCGTGMRAG
jgi:hypothetical protein